MLLLQDQKALLIELENVQNIHIYSVKYDSRILIIYCFHSIHQAIESIFRLDLWIKIL